ncbi:MAG: hypothetical protein KME64_03665 [Scytonematopsis contorta HA4267-MV1]|jgi:hypothetical protein|nr:hypothetical protein [Scytonematopsis contorta HA4267-MV1]
MTATLKSTIEGIKTLNGIPEKGKRFLSVNLANLDVAELMDIAKELGFKPELVQIPYRTHTEVHALLWHGFIVDTPKDLEAKFDELATRINADAIRYATGGWVTSM